MTDLSNRTKEELEGMELDARKDYQDKIAKAAYHLQQELKAIHTAKANLLKIPIAPSLAETTS